MIWPAALKAGEARIACSLGIAAPQAQHRVLHSRLRLPVKKPQTFAVVPWFWRARVHRQPERCRIRSGGNGDLRPAVERADAWSGSNVERRSPRSSSVREIAFGVVEARQPEISPNRRRGRNLRPLVRTSA